MKNILRLLAAGFSASFFTLAAQAADLAPGAYSAGSVKGDVSYKLAGSEQYMPLAAGVALPQGATVKTGANSSAMIVFGSGSTAGIDANSEIEITKFEQAVFSGPVPVDAEPAVSSTEIKVIDGGITTKVSKLKKGSAFTVSSPVGAAGVRGTVFRFTYSKADGKGTLSVSEGRVAFNGPGGGATQVAAGQKLSFSPTLNPDGSVQSVTLDVSKLDPAELAEIIAVLGAAAGDGAVTFQNNGGTIVITPVDTTQVGVSTN